MYQNEYWSHFEPLDSSWNKFALLIYLCIGTTGLTLNVMVLHYMSSIKKSRGRAADLLILNLVFSDIGKILSNIPMAMISCIVGEWIFGQIGCDMYAGLAAVCGFCSIITIVVMSIERYIIIKNPSMALKISKKVIKLCIFGCWGYSFLITLPQLTLKNRFVLEGVALGCTFDYLSRDVYTRCYMMIMVIGGFILPIALILIFYYFLYSMIRDGAKFFYTSEENLNTIKNLINKNETCNLKSVQLSLSLPNIHSTSLGYFTTLDHFKLKTVKEQSTLNDSKELIEKIKLIKVVVKAEMKIVRFTSVILAIFFITWFPYACVALIGQFSSNTYMYITPKTAFLPFIFAKLSSTLNPLFFILTNSRCFNYFRKILKKKKLNRQLRKNEIILKKKEVHKIIRNRNTL